MTSKRGLLALSIVAAYGTGLLVGCGPTEKPDDKLLKSGEYLAPPKAKSKGGNEP